LIKKNLEKYQVRNFWQAESNGSFLVGARVKPEEAPGF